MLQGVEFIFSIAVLIMSVVAHEVSHGYAAQMLGDPTARLSGRLTLNPIRHVDPVGSIIVPFLTYTLSGRMFGWAKPVPYNPYNLRHGKWGPVLVALAGPLTNMGIAVVIGLLIRVAPVLGIVSAAFFEIAVLIVSLNIVLAIFNLVPIPPLDGSKVLFALLPYQYSHVQDFLERYGFIALIIFMVYFWQYLTPIIVFFYSLITGVGLASY